MPDAPEDTYKRLMARHDLVGLDDDQALEHIGELTDLSGDLRRTVGLEQAMRLSEELQQRNPSAVHRATSHYFLGNVWSNLRVLAGEDLGAWEQPELEREIFHLRMALRDEAAPGLRLERVCQILTNLGNAMSAVGRPVEAIHYWDQALRRLPRFSMARGNRGYGLSYYAASVHDSGHKDLMVKFAHADLQSALSGNSRQYLEGNAHRGFERVKADIEGYLTAEYLAEDTNVADFPLGTSEEEVAYRRWCLQERLFLNPLNDLGPHAIAARDVLMLPPVVTHLGKGPAMPALQGMYNQLKQEFVSARYLYWEGITSEAIHFSDKDVRLYDTLDFPAYSLAVEKTKIAFRMAYSILDKIAYFLKHYLDLSISDRDATFRKVWYRDGKRRNGLEPVAAGPRNWPLRGLFWLSKDLHEDDPGFRESLEPEAQELRELRHAIEHRYLKLSHELWSGFRAARSALLDRIAPDTNRSEALDPLDDNLALFQGRSEFDASALSLFQMVRAALVYLCLAVHWEEERRSRERGADRPVPSMEAPIFDDELKF
jgi:tetratricopeptide (TPR) repeat protein